jgi:methylthioribose-1-phosphate isomerase
MAEADATLRASRPTAVNLFWALDAMQRELVAHADAGVADQAQALVRRAQQLQAEDVVVNQQLGAHGAALLPADALVLTHCNAGALATAGYGTALGVIRAAIAQGKRVRVLADETRPLLQGARLTAWELHAEGIDVTLITDNAAGHLMQHERIDAVVVGTDRVAANGDVANKIGTYMVAVLAQRHGIPFYVACPTSTIDMALPTGADIPIEERHASEVRGHGTTTWAPPGVAVRNPAFDVTPAELVTALITERGVWRQPNSARMQAWMQAR